ncbi:tRNA pseudouridine(55) synthase TruB [Murdochiella vaginalis]|uniref:tRNA pseudouridine(55) synthase TruB n=1 Tax=Murdochiella vaginalis TaxID=1852373 RepID=UPI0008FE5D4F|nr:tRNA pseudouridine(55) synthase TruB [Murdochiella vaginalis]
MIGILNVYKEADMTSFDVVAIVRRVLGTRRVGHIGTLDPMATGVLPVLIGKATRLSEYFDEGEKEYVFTMRFGEETDTLDSTGSVVFRSEKTNVTQEELLLQVERFVGTFQQQTPLYSAVKVKGRKLYEYARKGISVERPMRTITVSALTLEKMAARGAVFRCRCSKGTYIRQLIADMGRALGTYATMTALERTMVGEFTAAKAVPISNLKGLSSAEAAKYIEPADVALLHIPEIILDAKQAERASQGQVVALSLNGENLAEKERFHLPPGEKKLVRVYEATQFLGIGLCCQERLKMKKMLAE